MKKNSTLRLWWTSKDDLIFEMLNNKEENVFHHLSTCRKET